MIKKRLVIIMIFLLVCQLFLPQVSEAAVAGKAVNQAAKKVAKEIIVDQAVQMSMNLVLDPQYRFTPTESTPQAKQGYTMICMPRDKKTDGTCSSPVEVKKNLTLDDKKAIAAKAEINLDKKITGGIGATRWGKFVDWFLPTFAVGAGIAVITATLNGELGSFFDDLAFDTLAGDDFITGTDDILNSGLVTVTGNNIYANKKNVQFKSFNPFTQIPVIKISVRPNELMGTSRQVSIEGKKYIAFNPGGYVYTDPKIFEGDITFQHLQTFAASMVSKFTEVNDQGEPVINTTPLPKFDESGLSPTKPPNTQTQIVAPGAIPFTKTDTDEILIPFLKPDGTIGFKTKTGTIVNEDDVTVGDPDITYNPDGSTTVNKAPRPEPEPEPDPDPDPDETIPPDQEKPPEENGPTCTDKIELPRLSALFKTMSDAFPFSLPFDLMDGFNALFSEIGKEKPKVDYEFKGQAFTKKVTITMPDYFDNWMPFIHSMMLFIFDIGLLYGIYRLIRT